MVGTFGGVVMFRQRSQPEDVTEAIGCMKIRRFKVFANDE